MNDTIGNTITATAVDQFVHVNGVWNDRFGFHLYLTPGQAIRLAKRLTEQAEQARRLTARKTHCIRGHAFTPENTRITVRGARLCRACRPIRQALRRAKGRS